MSGLRHNGQGLAIGVDAGGTWVRIVARTCRESVASWAVPRPAGSRLARLLRGVWKRRGWRRADVVALAVASRGVWTARERTALARELAPLAQRVRALSDVEAALLGALDGRSGVIVVAGTGSIVLGRNRAGRLRRGGGLGPLLGDDGSAFWLGREWLRARARAGDVARARRLARAPNAVTRIAALAPRVLARARAGDRSAAAIVAAAQAALAADVRDVARGLRLPRPVKISWAGGVLADPWFRAGLRRALATLGIRAHWQAPAAEPASAAARLAADLAAWPRGQRP